MILLIMFRTGFFGWLIKAESLMSEMKYVRGMPLTGRAIDHECGWGNQHVDADQNMGTNMTKYDLMDYINVN